MTSFFRADLENLELDSPDMLPSTIKEIRVVTKADPRMSLLCEFVAQGWPPDKSRVPAALRRYFPWRDELAVYHSVPYKSHKIVLSQHLQSYMLRKIDRVGRGKVKVGILSTRRS